jgi:hypothetical protein
MATRDKKKVHSNGNGNGNGRNMKTQSKSTESHTESIRVMIIQHFEQSPLRLDRRDVERIANEMVKIAERSREEVDRMNIP